MSHSPHVLCTAIAVWTSVRRGEGWSAALVGRGAGRWFLGDLPCGGWGLGLTYTQMFAYTSVCDRALARRRCASAQGANPRAESAHPGVDRRASITSDAAAFGSGEILDHQSIDTAVHKCFCVSKYPVGNFLEPELILRRARQSRFRQRPTSSGRAGAWSRIPTSPFGRTPSSRSWWPARR